MYPTSFDLFNTFFLLTFLLVARYAFFYFPPIYPSPCQTDVQLLFLLKVTNVPKEKT